jgi:hypothetical protein
MPHEITEVEVVCDISFCSYWDCDGCTADVEVEDLEPSDTDCRYFHFNQIVSKEDIQDVIDEIKELDIPFVSIDPEALTFLRRPLYKDSKLIFQYAIIQGSKEDLDKFNFYKTVDGGIGFENKDQLELPI